MKVSLYVDDIGIVQGTIKVLQGASLKERLKCEQFITVKDVVLRSRDQVLLLSLNHLVVNIDKVSIAYELESK